jgi:Ala-tRNA(Pro) deacylase
MTTNRIIARVPTDTYHKMIDLFEAGGARYRLIDHAAEGRTEAASVLRNNRLSQAAKCIVVRVNTTKKDRKHLLAVVPGDRRVNFAQLSRLVGGSRVGFASREVAERLSGSVSGAIPPISFHPDLQLIVDRSLLANDELFFNAARLNRSVALATTDYVNLVRPQVEDIVAYIA